MEIAFEAQDLHLAGGWRGGSRGLCSLTGVRRARKLRL